MPGLVTPHFRKLQVDLPVEEPVDSKPWLLAGIVFAVVIVGLIVFLYWIETKGIHQKDEQSAVSLMHR